MGVFVIAEVGSVHDGSFGLAQRLINVAAECGADAVKFQTHISSAETTRDAPMPPYFKGEPRYEYFERTGFSLEQWKALKTHCEGCNVEFLSSPFSEEAVDLLETVGVARYKVPSGEVTNLPLLKKMAATGKPIILSSGMNSWDELDIAVEAIRQHNENLTVLQCTSEYPCPYERVGLNIMTDMQSRYDVPVGLSDHTLTTYACLTAVALGATVLEKHFTLSQKMYGSDARHSLEPDGFADLVVGVRAVETMTSCQVDKNEIGRYSEMKRIFEKSVVAVVDIPSGTVVTADMIGIKKPGTGIPAAQKEDVIGSRTLQNLKADSVIMPGDIEWKRSVQQLRKSA